MIIFCLNFPSCHVSKPQWVRLVCEVLNLRVYICMQCILSMCEWERDKVWEVSHTHTHTLSSVSPTLSAFLLIHLLQLSGWFYHPVSCREITSDKLGWLNRLEKLTDPAPPYHYLLNATLHGWRTGSAKTTVLHRCCFRKPAEYWFKCYFVGYRRFIFVMWWTFTRYDYGNRTLSWKIWWFLDCTSVPCFRPNLNRTTNKPPKQKLVRLGQPLQADWFLVS